MRKQIMMLEVLAEVGWNEAVRNEAVRDGDTLPLRAKESAKIVLCFSNTHKVVTEYVNLELEHDRRQKDCNWGGLSKVMI